MRFLFAFPFSLGDRLFEICLRVEVTSNHQATGPGSPWWLGRVPKGFLQGKLSGKCLFLLLLYDGDLDSNQSAWQLWGPKMIC